MKINNPNIYVEAHDKVMMRHKSEVIAEEVQKQVEAELARHGIKPGAPQQGGGRQPTAFSESGVNRPVRQAGPRKVRLTNAEQDHAFARGMSHQNYAAWKTRQPDEQRRQLERFKGR